MRSMIWAGRGRVPGKYHSYSEMRLVGYLARISVKHRIDSEEFFTSLVDAWKNKKSICENLAIECREKMQDQGVFLLTSGDGWVAQFPIPEHVLRQTNPLKELAQDMLFKEPALAKTDTEPLQIKNLRAKMKHVRVKARVLEISKPREVLTRFGSQAYVSNALIADNAESIELSLWNEQANAVSIGDVIEIENGHVAYFRGKRQLRIGRNGEINIVKDKDFPSIQQLRKTSPGLPKQL